MRIEDMTWGQVEELVKFEKRAVLPLGSVEQHAKLSLAVDKILAYKVAVDAAAGRELKAVRLHAVANGILDATIDQLHHIGGVLLEWR